MEAFGLKINAWDSGPKFERAYRVEAKRLRTTLELIMGYRQVHEAPGLELYQDKIQLSQEGDSEAFEQHF